MRWNFEIVVYRNLHILYILYQRSHVPTYRLYIRIHFHNFLSISSIFLSIPRIFWSICPNRWPSEYDKSRIKSALNIFKSRCITSGSESTLPFNWPNFSRSSFTSLRNILISLLLLPSSSSSSSSGSLSGSILPASIYWIKLWWSAWLWGKENLSEKESESNESNIKDEKRDQLLKNNGTDLKSPLKRWRSSQWGK